MYLFDLLFDVYVAPVVRHVCRLCLLFMCVCCVVFGFARFVVCVVFAWCVLRNLFSGVRCVRELCCCFCMCFGLFMFVVSFCVVCGVFCFTRFVVNSCSLELCYVIACLHLAFVAFGC